MMLQEYFDQTIQGKQPSPQDIKPWNSYGLYRNYDLNKARGVDWVGPTREWAERNGLNTEVLDDVS